MSSGETWRDIPDFPSYAVSNRGRVKRIAGGRGAVPGRILRQRKYHGYMYVRLSEANEPTLKTVHSLVASAFLGACPEGMEVNHRDGVKSNNAPSNLEYVTHAENMRHAYHELGRLPTAGEAHGASKLTREDVRRLRRLRKRGWLLRELSEEFGVHTSVVSRVARRESWAHV